MIGLGNTFLIQCGLKVEIVGFTQNSNTSSSFLVGILKRTIKAILKEID